MQLIQASDRLLVVSHQTQVDSPTNANDAAEDCTVFEGNNGEADDRDQRPELLTGEQKWEEVLRKCQWDMSLFLRGETYRVQCRESSVKRLAL